MIDRRLGGKESRRWQRQPECGPPDPRAGLAGHPPARSTSSSSASASPAPASPSTRSPAACRCWRSTPHDLAFGTSRWSLQARPRRAALPRLRPGRRRPRERRRARHPDGGHRPAPHPRAADADPAQRRRHQAAGRRDPRRLRGGDLLRRGARTARHPPPPAPGLGDRGAASWRRRCARTGCAAALLGWDGQLEDDARLVVAIARTAASYGAHVRTRARVLSADRDGGAAARRADRRTGARGRARTVVNATGVWAGDLVADGSGCAPAAAPTWCCAPRRLPRAARRPSPRRCRASTHRFVMVLPQPDGRVYVGLTDEPVDGPVPDVPEPTERRDRLPARRRLRARSTAADPRRRGRRLRRAAAAARRRAPQGDAPPTSPAGTRCSPATTAS